MFLQPCPASLQTSCKYEEHTHLFKAELHTFLAEEKFAWLSQSLSFLWITIYFFIPRSWSCCATSRVSFARTLTTATHTATSTTAAPVLALSVPSSCSTETQWTPSEKTARWTTWQEARNRRKWVWEWKKQNVLGLVQTRHCLWKARDVLVRFFHDKMNTGFPKLGFAVKKPQQLSHSALCKECNLYWLGWTLVADKVI